MTFHLEDWEITNPSSIVGCEKNIIWIKTKVAMFSIHNGKIIAISDSGCFTLEPKLTGHWKEMAYVNLGGKFK